MCLVFLSRRKLCLAKNTHWSLLSVPAFLSQLAGLVQFGVWQHKTLTHFPIKLHHQQSYLDFLLATSTPLTQVCGLRKRYNPNSSFPKCKGNSTRLLYCYMQDKKVHILKKNWQKYKTPPKMLWFCLFVCLFLLSLHVDFSFRLTYLHWNHLNSLRAASKCSPLFFKLNNRNLIFNDNVYLPPSIFQ